MRDRLLTRARFQARRLISKRRRFEELLREESQFASIFESSAIGIVLADAEGRPRDCNPAFSRMFGYTEDELRTMRISDFAHPDDAAKTERALKALVEGKRSRYHAEWRCIHKDGSLVWANLVASTILDANGELALTIATIENISDRKSAEADTDAAISARKSAEADTDAAISARKSAEADTDAAISARKSAEADTSSARDYITAVIETAEAMVVGLDLNGSVRFLNKEAEEITGYTRQELLGRNWFEVVVPRERYPAVWETFERLLADGLPSRFENPILTKSGEERYIVWRNTEVKEDGLTTGTVSIGIDMTELKQAEEALRRERDLVAKIIETSPIGIVARDRQGEITFANADAERVLGLTRTEATGQTYNAPDGRITDYEGRPFPDEELPLQRVMATGRPVYDVRYAIENASGERICLSVNAAPVLDGNGELDGMISSIEDVSERRRAKETRELLEAELLQSQRLETVGTLAGGVAHNFNNLLTAITGYSELLLARLPADSDLRPDVEEIRRAGERAAEVASGLLRFSRRGRDKHERLDLNAMIREMETLLRQVIRSNIEITTVLADGLDLVQNNQGVIEQVVVNLIVNASDAMPDGGKLTIETANLHLAEPRLVRDLSLPAGNFVTLIVRDSGIGMDEETQAKIFEPFYSTKGPDRGTGLGLSTVHGIVEDSEGAVLVESAPGQGSTFTVFLPSIPDQRSSP